MFADFGRGARDVDIIVHHATVNAPSPHMADTIEADTDGGGPARSALAKGMRLNSQASPGGGATLQ